MNTWMRVAQEARTKAALRHGRVVRSMGALGSRVVERRRLFENTEVSPCVDNVGDLSEWRSASKAHLACGRNAVVSR